jgi:hypothetical protein
MHDHYTKLLHLIAENPGMTADEIEAMADDIPAVDKFREAAIEAEDIVCANGRHWIVRKGEFAFHEYDHKTTE